MLTKKKKPPKRESRLQKTIDFYLKFLEGKEPGHPLPKKEAVAVWCEVSTGTVQNALMILKERGLIISYQGTKARKTTLTEADRHNRDAAYKFAAKEIADLVIDMGLKRGDRLPSVRDLSETINRTPSTTAMALKKMEVMGIVKTQYAGPHSKTILLKTPVIEDLSS
jgi:DNA-binding transcriptional regulator YhcF (GntR family)